MTIITIFGLSIIMAFICGYILGFDVARKAFQKPTENKEENRS